MNNITLRDRYRGAMVGVLCGDALGAPYEWKPPEGIVKDIEARGGLVSHKYEPFDYIDPWKKQRLVKKGQPTDDSELAAALAMSLVAKPEFDAEDLYMRLRSFIIDRKSILTDVAYGSGGTLRAALTPPTYEESKRLFAAGEIQTPPSNGSLMRCIAVPLRFGKDKDVGRAISVAWHQSAVTHRNPQCISACAAYTSIVHQVLGGREVDTSWGIGRIGALHLNAADRPELSAIEQVFSIEISKPDYWQEMKEREGWVVLSLRVAVWAAVTSESFAEGIIKAISVGGDTDTYAAIAGGILGARYGLESIPSAWQDCLQGWEIMVDLADQLYDIAHS